MREPDGGGRLATLQAVRAVAALLVIGHHVWSWHAHAFRGARVTGVLANGWIGVDLFFVLSGFVIATAHDADRGRPERFLRYAGRRFRRLVPFLWISVVLVAAGHAGLSALRGRPPFAAPESEPANVLRTLLLQPTPRRSLPVAWSLTYEALFYAFFALAILLPRRVGTAGFALWTAGLAYAATLPAGEPSWRRDDWLSVAADPRGLGFALGVVAAAAVRAGRVPAWIAVPGGLALAANLLTPFRWPGPSDALTVALPSALLVAGLAAWERGRFVAVPRPLTGLGDASYAVYLWHGLGITGTYALLSAGAPRGTREIGPWLQLLPGAVGLGLGLLAHVAIERPLLRLKRTE